MNTNLKIKIAKMLSKIISIFLHLFGKNPREHITYRKGIHWSLNLNEGIDLAIFIFGHFELSTIKAITKILKEGSNVLDVGANIGALTLPIAQIVGEGGQVYSFEPTTWAFERLKKNINLNEKLKNRINLLNAKVGHSREFLPNQFFSSWDLAAKNKTHEEHGGTLHDASAADFYTIDEFIKSNSIESIDLIKIDVDGYEVEVLKGAKETLLNRAPFLIIEISPYQLKEAGTSIKELIYILKEYGYNSVQTMTGTKLTMEWTKIQSKLPSRGGENLLFGKD